MQGLSTASVSRDIERATSAKAGWATPEIWRALGEQHLQDGSRPLEDVESLFRAAISLSKQQGTLSWELRAATSLARLISHRGDRHEAEDVLAATLSRITQGASTKDVLAAHAVLGEVTADREDGQCQD
ncbi:hypothetical protein [Paraburkholderia unamae]|uniref:hypothetical protein n=1 Tax=Paraburkholderia unamae TaxID=219649 RepID=UPI0010577240|nr:hypothetical protein [Paraburkholderia unamae]CAG9273754.1 hypothetical protein PUN4_80069 [Paraburkholderia unamae]